MNENVAIQLQNVSLDFPVTKSGAKYIKDLFTRRNKSRSSKFYRAVDEMDLEIQSGEVFGVIGPNGAGKSTLLRVMAGIYAPDEGSVRVRGRISLLAGLGAGSGCDAEWADFVSRGLVRWFLAALGVSRRREWSGWGGEGW